MLKTYTKRLMVEALKSLLASKTLDKITIRDITEKCGASKQTFYNHFQDKYELFYYAVEKVLQENLDNSFQNSNSFEEVILNYYRTIESDRTFYKAFIRDVTAREHINNCIVEYAGSFFRNQIVDAISQEGITEEQELAIRFTSVGLAELVVDWIRSGMTRSPELQAKVSYTCIPESLKKYCVYHNKD
jgi:AcrR family transcriptional regulator